ncbi:hypothetical protein A2U01_0074031, partial [Trifolium medium]|nr:hypothetical protein [Trifolium medium]
MAMGRGEAGTDFVLPKFIKSGFLQTHSNFER